MQAATSLLGFILNLLKDPQAQAEFRASPVQVLSAHGLSGVSAADIHETLPFLTDHRSVELASTSHSAPPSVVPVAGESGTHAAVQYLHHITGTYRYDDHGAHIHDSGHENIWAIDDMTHDFDGGHVAPDGPDPATPGPGGTAGTGHWAGDGHGNTFIYGDHTNGRIYGDHPSGADQGDSHLHDFGSGAPTAVPGDTSSPAVYSSDTGGSHGSPGSSIPTHPGDVASMTGADGRDHQYDHHTSLGESYDQHGHEYGVDDDHGGMHLDLH
jgi:hypothetical protein